MVVPLTRWHTTAHLLPRRHLHVHISNSIWIAMRSRDSISPSNELNLVLKPSKFRCAAEVCWPECNLKDRWSLLKRKGAFTRLSQAHHGAHSLDAIIGCMACKVAGAIGSPTIF